MERKKIMTWTLTWLSVSAAALNATLQLLVIYRLTFSTWFCTLFFSQIYKTSTQITQISNPSHIVKLFHIPN